MLVGPSPASGALCRLHSGPRAWGARARPSWRPSATAPEPAERQFLGSPLAGASTGTGSPSSTRSKAEGHIPAEIQPAGLLVGFHLSDALANAMTLGLGECCRDRQESNRCSPTPRPFRLSTTLSASKADRKRRSSLATMMSRNGTAAPRSKSPMTIRAQIGWAGKAFGVSVRFSPRKGGLLAR